MIFTIFHCFYAFYAWSISIGFEWWFQVVFFLVVIIVFTVMTIKSRKKQKKEELKRKILIKKEVKSFLKSQLSIFNKIIDFEEVIMIEKDKYRNRNVFYLVIKLKDPKNKSKEEKKVFEIEGFAEQARGIEADRWVINKESSLEDISNYKNWLLQKNKISKQRRWKIFSFFKNIKKRKKKGDFNNQKNTFPKLKIRKKKVWTEGEILNWYNKRKLLQEKYKGSW